MTCATFCGARGLILAVLFDVRGLGRGAVAVLGLLGLLVAPTRGAEDVVIVRAKDGSESVRMTGEILDLTGSLLKFKRTGGREESVEADRVIDLQTAWTARHLAGNEAFQRGQYAEALTEYRAAIADEPRIWVRRRILAQTIWCLRNTDQIESAFETFSQLYRNDPTTSHFDTMPIAWLAEAPSPALQQRARAALEPGTMPAVRLMGASWLVPTADRSAALAALQELLRADDPRVAFWAEAQLWRPQAATAPAETVARWRDRWEKMPAALQPGPAVVLGQAYSRLKQPEDAALLFLRSPILQPVNRGLAAQALLAAGREFETMDQADEAVVLYREIVTDYGTASVAAVAQDRIKVLRGQPAPP